MSEDEVRRSLSVEIDADRLRVTLRPIAPRPPRGLAASSLERTLRDCGVRHGLDRAILDAVISEWKRGAPGPWVAAVGVPAEAGRPEGLERLPPPPRSGADAVELLPLYVKRGDPLFRVRRATPPREGIDVCGRPIPPPPTPAAAALAPGRGIVVENGTWISRATGFLQAGEGVLQVVKTLLHFHDLGPGTYRWPGDAEIAGSIAPNTSLELEGGLTVGGDVGRDVTIRTDGDVRIEGTLAGGGSTRIDAEGRVTLRRAEAAQIAAGGDIVVTEALVDCRVRTRALLRAHEKGCKILGGAIDAIGGAEVYDVEEDAGHRATISVGRANWINEEMRAIEGEIRKWMLYHGKLFDDFQKRHAALVRDRANLWQLPEADRVAFLRDEEEVLAEQKRVDERITALRSRIEALSASRAVDSRAVIRIHGAADGTTALLVRGRRYECGKKPLRQVTLGIFGEARRVCAVPSALFESSEMR